MLSSHLSDSVCVSFHFPNLFSTKSSITTSKAKKINKMFLINVENHPRIANYQFNVAAVCLVYKFVWLVGWLNSGAHALVIRHHLLKVGNFNGTWSEHRFCLQKVKK